MLRAQEDSGGVDIHDALPALGAEGILEGAAADAGVVHEDVEPSEARDRLPDHALPVCLDRDIGPNEGGLATRLVDLGLDPLTLVLEQVCDYDRGAFPGEQPDLFGAHPIGSTADKRHFAFQSHVFPP